MDRKSFEEGIILALVSPPIPHVVKKQPIAYSYNGVILPALPELDREMYPYAMIIKDVGNSLILCKFKPIAQLLTDGTTKILSAGEEQEFGNAVRYDIVDGSWKYIWGAYNSYYVYAEDLIWCNTDIYYEDGTLYQATTDPVPVYE